MRQKEETTVRGNLELRLEQTSCSPGDRVGESLYPAAPARGPRRGRILIMDDDRMVRETMTRQLTVCGYEVVAAAEGRQAVTIYQGEKAAGRSFDAVILDLQVGNGWGGEQTLEELRRLDPGVKAMVCSGTLAGGTADYLRKGFRAVLGKPYSLGDLRALVEGVSAGVRNA